MRKSGILPYGVRGGRRAACRPERLFVSVTYDMAETGAGRRSVKPLRSRRPVQGGIMASGRWLRPAGLVLLPLLSAPALAQEAYALAGAQYTRSLDETTYSYALEYQQNFFEHFVGDRKSVV